MRSTPQILPNRPGTALKAAGVRPSKGRGQNFLVQPAVAARIIEVAELEAQDSVVEIGPGLGILTESILDAGPRKLTLVEVDRRLAATIAARFGKDARVSVIERDFLRFSLFDLGEGPFKIIGNLPFNVATAMLGHLSDFRRVIVRLVLMFQREVAQRIRAAPGTRDYGVLSLVSSLYWKTTGHFRVAAGAFYPKPKVDAEVLIMEPRREPTFTSEQERQLRTVAYAAFSTPRKILRNSLTGGLRLDAGLVESALEQAGIDPSARPAILDCAHLIALAEILPPALGRPSEGE